MTKDIVFMISSIIHGYSNKYIYIGKNLEKKSNEKKEY